MSVFRLIPGMTGPILTGLSLADNKFYYNRKSVQIISHKSPIYPNKGQDWWQQKISIQIHLSILCVKLFRAGGRDASFGLKIIKFVLLKLRVSKLWFRHLIASLEADSADKRTSSQPVHRTKKDNWFYKKLSYIYYRKTKLKLLKYLVRGVATIFTDRWWNLLHFLHC